MNSDPSNPAGGENRKVTRAAGVVGAATLLSRIFGYVRDMVVASFFGAGMAADAFIAAFRIPNLLRRLFGEGSLSIAFVPVFTDVMVNGDREEGIRLAISAMKLLFLVLLGVTLVGVVAAPWIIRVVAPGFSHLPEKMALTVTLTRLMFPYVIFIGLVALCMGILNVLGHFAAPAVAPVLLNLAMIGAIAAVSRFSDSETVRVLGLAGGVLLGGALQLALQLPFLVRNGVRFWRRSGLWHPAMRRVGLLMLPTIFGAAVYQINILVGTLLASLLPEGSVSYLYYADRLVQFPLGIFAQAAATAVLPSLSRQAAGGDHAGMGDTFGHAISLVLFITIPAMVGLIVLRYPIVVLLFKRGAFDAWTARLTSDALLYYCLGLWAFSAVRIVVSTFYAMQDTRTPVKTATISIAANILLGMALMGPMKHCGLALATSLASMINLVLLVYVLRQRMGAIRWRRIGVSTLKTLAASAMMAGVAVWVCRAVAPDAGSAGVIRLLVAIGAAIGGGVAVFAAAAWLFKIAEWQKVAGLVKRSLTRS
ncbi:putative lipid II flippase MurJ [Desulfosarcina ovata subsp. sediminis]|uniref:Probable lipid II flippase MurJ n=1 Tax=Desulfosarcina ovata subsp. sediminis TaxID=885957 RepID=A0A5K7ZQD6_9BACT|nr:murein biosynthesis integral membrane protein MurJ [Desulfosarcina ovata]BBO81760.1 putative lipid II flippase MurJ [Desulfosarcina ovata subsp. sediminis]